MEKFEYFMEETNKRLDKIDDKLEEVLKSKWQIEGGTILLCAALTVALNILAVIFNK